MRKPPALGVPLSILIVGLCITFVFGAEVTGVSDNDIAGPIVKASINRVKDALLQANVTGDSAEKAKSLAQIIDEALEKEFPEEKQEAGVLGKDYNETAKQEDVRFPLLRSVIQEHRSSCGCKRITAPLDLHTVKGQVPQKLLLCSWHM